MGIDSENDPIKQAGSHQNSDLVCSVQYDFFYQIVRWRYQPFRTDFSSRMEWFLLTLNKEM